MAPSSPPVKRTLHLLKTPDILLANDTNPAASFKLNTIKIVVQLRAIDSIANLRPTEFIA
jgi:hypothetical protein